jgi:hypothetical protein
MTTQNKIATVQSVLLVLSIIPSLDAQTLQITSPPQGTVVAPGRAFSLTVSGVPAGAPGVIAIAAFGEPDPTMMQTLTAPPWSFSLTVPATIHSMRTYWVTVRGGGQTARIGVDVERADSPIGLTSQFASYTTDVGDRGAIDLHGTYSDGSILDLDQSTKTTFTSGNNAIVRTTGSGFTAVAPGSTQITVTHMTQTLVIPVAVKPPLAIVPNHGWLHPSKTQQFLANAAISGYTPVIWSVSPGYGTITAAGLYTAPVSMFKAGADIITATSSTIPAASASATVNLYPELAVGVSPCSTTLTAGQSGNFAATIANDPFNVGIAWSSSPVGVGAINSGNGTYYAPSTISALQTVTVTAMSLVDTTVKATASVVLAMAPMPGTIYISDSQNNRIRTVNGSGIIATFAGNGMQGFSGDCSAGASAELHNPFGIALDRTGSLYIADADNNRVRKVGASGTITTIAGNGGASYSGDGGLATAARA